MNKPAELKRTLGLFALVAYGVGDTLGAGIYALVGKIAGMVGPACWISFLIALIAAGFTALSYAELGSRFPFASGEAHYTYEATRWKIFSHGVGFLVFMSGITSMCASSHAFAGYLTRFFTALPPSLIVILFFVVVGAVTLSGIENSSKMNLLCTAIEVSGLLVVIAAGIFFLGKSEVNYLSFAPELEGQNKTQAVLSGAVLAFFAFIGFEDMVKASEEVKEPQKNLPRAILLTLAITGVIYILVALSAVTVLDLKTLKTSAAPLVDVVKTGLPFIPIGVFTAIALFAVSNTALVNFMMASRILYGMAHDGLVPAWFGKVHARFKTPHTATLAVFATVLVLTLTGNLMLLAQSTAVLLLCAFFTVNLSLLIIKLRKDSPAPAFNAPAWAPVLGFLSCLGLLFYAAPSALLTAVILLGVSFALFFLNKGILKG